MFYFSLSSNWRRTVGIICAVGLLCAFFTLFIISTNTARAQEAGSATSTAETAGDGEISANEEEVPADVILDETITFEDLETVEASVLPGSILHPFKRLGWTLQEVITFDPVADAELKLQHANQELSEVKQLIDEQGLSDISPGIIDSAIDRFEGRLDNIKDIADNLRDAQESNPQEVDDFLNDLTDKQFKYQKVLESIEKEVIETIENNPDGVSTRIEDVFITVTETKDKALEHFGEILSTIEEDSPEKIAERIIKITDKQDGSEFKHLKNLEILKRLEDQVPITAQGAIRLAQENTLKFFNRDILAIPEVARAERFEMYNKFNYGDETRQLYLLDELKLLDDIPPEILQKIEEVKEFAVAKFEEKMAHFDQPDILESYMMHLSGENFEDIVLAEQFASRVVFENNPEIKARMDEFRDRSVAEFTQRFTDPDSQAQVVKFQELERILEERPGDPKVIRMMQELEDQVRSDPNKAAFLNQLDQLENKMRGEFEERFRQEGEYYFDRIGTLDPRDFEIYQEFSGEDFLPPGMAEMFMDHEVDQYRDYMRDVDDPEFFDRFNGRFTDMPQFVIDEISYRDNGFGDAMQFKRQAMEKLRFEQERQMEFDRQQVDFQERELFYQLDRVRRQADEDFWRRIDSIPYENFDERKALFEEKRQADLARLDEEHNARLDLFNRRLELDPWCDASCQQIQQQFIDQEFRHQKERIQDDYISQQNQIEFDLSREKENNPLFGLCSTPESCDAYCQNNPQVEACKVFFHEPIFYDDFGPKDYDCGPGHYFDFGINGCVADPYYRPPTDFTNCPFGAHWNPDGGFCEPDYIPPPNIYPVEHIDCGPDAYFEFRENRCVPYYIGPACPPGFFLGPFGECKQENFQCPDYSVMDMSCPEEGQYRDEYIDHNGCKVFGECRTFGQTTICPDLSLERPFPCPDGFYRDTFIDYNGCKMFGECVPFEEPVYCPVYDVFPCPAGTYRGAGHTNADGCYMPGECIPYEEPPTCPGDITVSYPAPCPAGQEREIITEPNGCRFFGECVGDLLPPVTCDAYFEGYTYNSYTNTCEWSSTSGCSDPYKHKSLRECEEGYGIVTPTICPSMPTVGTCPAGEEKIVSFSSPECGTYYSCVPIGDPTGTGYCGDGLCSSVESDIICPADCSYVGPTYCPPPSYWDSAINACSGGTDYWCGNYVCDPGEDATYCPSDCGGGTAVDCVSYKDSASCVAQTNCYWYADATISYCYYDSGSSGYCGNNVCDNLESELSCPSDCGGGASTYCTPPSYWDSAINGCNPGEDYTSSYWCGNNICDPGEDSYSCLNDCGGGTTSTSSMQNCFYPNATIDGAPAGYTIWCEADYYNCYEGASSGAPVSLSGLSLGAPSWCESGWSDSTTSSGYCGDNICNSFETSSSCPLDCGASTSTTDTCNYNGVCESSETATTCASDCSSGGATISCNYDGLCSGGETIEACPSDCVYLGGGPADACSSSAPFCTSESTCTSLGYFWCNNACSSTSCTTDSTSTASGCPTQTFFGTCYDGYDYDSNGCVIGCLPPPEPVSTCATSTDFGTCNDGYDYDSQGCVIGCLPPPLQQPATCMTEADFGACDYGYDYDSFGCVTGCLPPPSASVWDLIKSALFGR